MDSFPTSATGSSLGKKPDKTRRSWSSREEDVLISSLKEVIANGWKSENGFKAGYLTLLENSLKAAIPGTNLRGNPHINSKIHVWKKTYSTLVTLLARSGVGWNDTENTIDVTDETWESIVKYDPSFRTLRHKQWNHFSDWVEIFGNDRATGEQSRTFEDALHQVLELDKQLPNEEILGTNHTSNPFDCVEDSISETHTPTSRTQTEKMSKSKKRKQATDHEDTIVQAINNLAHITKDTMSQLIKEMASEEKMSEVQDKVLSTLQEIKELSEEEQVAVAKLLFNNHNDLALFNRLGERGRICMVNKLLRGE